MVGIVIAIGGNAISNPASQGDAKSQQASIRRVAAEIAKLYAQGVRVIVTHGNGPQVGRELERNEIAAKLIPELPLYYLTAETESVIGSMISTALSEELIKIGRKPEVCTIVSHVIVEQGKAPMKPIGPVLTQSALKSELKRGKFSYIGVHGGYRRVVPSPRPLSILESDMVGALSNRGIVISGGGGGVPLVRKGGSYKGVEAVVDKDRTSALLARDIGADRLVILTDTEYLYTPNRRKAIKRISASNASKMAGSLEEGTIRPKLEACIEFVKWGGKAAYIGNLYKLEDILNDKSGTKVTK